MVLQSSGLDLRIDGGKVSRLATDGTAVLLGGSLVTAVNNSPSTLLLLQRDLQCSSSAYCLRSRSTSHATHAEQRARTCTASVADNDDILRVEEGRCRCFVIERLALLAEPLAERVPAAVDDLLDRGVEPVVVGREERVVRERPVARVVEQEVIGVCTGNDLFHDLLSEGTGACGRVQTSLRDGGILGTNNLESQSARWYTPMYMMTDNAVEPLWFRVSA